MTVDLPAGWPGWLFGVLGVLFPFIVAWRRGKIDESALILGRWKEMVDQHAEDIKGLREELRTEREDNNKLRELLSEAREKIQALEDEVAGLKRQLRTYLGTEGYLSELVAKVSELERKDEGQ